MSGYVNISVTWNYLNIAKLGRTRAKNGLEVNERNTLNNTFYEGVLFLPLFFQHCYAITWANITLLLEVKNFQYKKKVGIEKENVADMNRHLNI